MTGVKFVTVSEIERKATQLVAEVEKGKLQIIITKHGKPVALLEPISGTVTGRKETVSSLKLQSTRIISELIKSGKRVVITRDAESVAILKKISDVVFRVEK